MRDAAQDAAAQDIVFEAGAEARVAELLAERGAERVLILALPHHRAGAERVAADLGERCVGIFDEVAQHVPLALAEAARARAREARVDWVLAHGGGTVTGFAKAVALTEAVRLAAVPTTYAGSERTGIWGLRGPEGKETGRDPRVRPELVIYDPELTRALPKKTSLMSLVNAMAQAVTALWVPASEEQAEAAVDALRELLAGFEAVAADPGDLAGRTRALRGAMAAGAFIEAAPLGLHHLLAHVLGGTFGVEHAAAHTTVLPYSTHFDALAAPRALARLQAVFGADPPARLYDLAREHGLPHSLKDLELTAGDCARLVGRALVRGYDNPRPYDEAVLHELVSDIFHARRPSIESRRRGLSLEGPHAGLLATERGTPLERARGVIIAVHGRGAAADRFTRDLEAHTGPLSALTLLAPQAGDNAWYPKGFAAPLEDNQPWLDSALEVLDAAWTLAREHVPAEQIAVVGFSQGACLALSWARSRRVRLGALLALSGAHLDVEGTYEDLVGTEVYLSRSDRDPWIPRDRFEATVAALQAAGVSARVHREPGGAHTLHEADGAALVRLRDRLLAQGSSASG